MVYLESFRLAGADAEDSFVLSYPYQLEMQCYSHNNVYPFKIFPQKQLSHLTFEPVTVFYGGNGSGKSTVLNVITEKLGLERSAPFNDTPFMADYLKLCGYELARGVRGIPRGSRKITSDDVFDYLLDVRMINEGVDRRREELFEEYTRLRDTPMQPLRSLDDLEGLRQRNEARARTKSAYVARRLPRELDGRSNGESAFLYFTDKIRENALYLLDEPENSLSAELQIKLVSFIEESVRFYNCQFIISTHSPFLLAMKNAKIYDLDTVPVGTKRWTELGNVKIYYDFFKQRMDEFE
ncbi:MAG: AAA family ATPase [Clostridia bacterium]|nr:AAA family ATPase [Clostridia bacterium]